MDEDEEKEESIVVVGDSKVDDDGESRPRAESLLARCLAVSRSISRVTSSVIPRYSKSSSFSCSMSSAVSYPLSTNTEVRFSKLRCLFDCFSIRTSMNLKLPSLPLHLPLQIPVGPILTTSIRSPLRKASACRS